MVQSLHSCANTCNLFYAQLPGTESKQASKHISSGILCLHAVAGSRQDLHLTEAMLAADAQPEATQASRAPKKHLQETQHP